MGGAAEVVGAYKATLMETSRRLTPEGPQEMTFQGRALIAGENRIGSGELRLDRVRLLGPEGAVTGRVAQGQGVTVQARVDVSRPVPSAFFSITITDAAGALCFDTNSQVDGVALPDLTGGEVIELSFDRLDLSPGSYTISLGLWQSDWSHAYDYHADAYNLEVSGAASKGPLAPPRRWVIHTGGA